MDIFMFLAGSKFKNPLAANLHRILELLTLVVSYHVCKKM